jgi:hypothetical protein
MCDGLNGNTGISGSSSREMNAANVRCKRCRKKCRQRALSGMTFDADRLIRHKLSLLGGEMGAKFGRHLITYRKSVNGGVDRKFGSVGQWKSDGFQVSGSE